MTKVKFIHTADLHLDTPFKGVVSWNNELATKLKEATFNSFKKIIDLCLKEKVNFLIISGDIFDSENKSLVAQLKFVSELKRLSDNGIPTYFICGNHDPLSSWLDTIQLPENVFRFNSSKGNHYTFSKQENPIADIHGISFQTKVVKENLAHKYNKTENPSPISIAILHGTVGTPGPHENYAPFKVEDVAKKGFDYWALGHIHKGQVIHDSQPVIVYPGNPQGRDFGETGIKGCCLVEITADNKPTVKFIPTQLIRFEEIEIDLSGEKEVGKLLTKLDEAKINIPDYDDNDSYILRITLKGRTSLHSQLNEPGEIEQLKDHFNEGQLSQINFAWIDQIYVKTLPDIDIEQVKKGADFAAEILKIFDEYEGDKQKLMGVIHELDEDMVNYQVKKEIPELTGPEQKEMFERAKWILLNQLLKKT